MPGTAVCKIGLFGVGLEAYWNQFPLLKDRLEGYLNRVHEQLFLKHPHIVNAGLVDSYEKAAEAGQIFRSADVDVIFLYVPTYALSANVLPAVLRLHVPVIILNLTPASSIDYTFFNSLGDRRAMTGEWLAHCSACTVPELINTFRRASLSFHLISGTLEEAACWQEAGDWIEAAQVACNLRHNRLGCMGHYYSGMMDIYTDFTQLSIEFGSHIEIIELDELANLRKKVTVPEIKERMHLFRERFDIQSDCTISDLERAAITSIALDQLVKHYHLGSLAYYYKGIGNIENEETISSIILGNSLLTANGIPVACEYEIKNAMAMKILDSFHAGGSFTEFYALDYDADIVLMGHDGPGHIDMADGKIKVKPLSVYHGKNGKGLSVEMSVKNGPVTLLSLLQQADGRFALLVAEGESVPGPILEIGNTNSRYRFSIGANKFMNEWCIQGPAHHCAVGIGHIAHKIHKLGNLLKIPVKQVC